MNPLFIVVFIVIVDQLSKYYISHWLTPNISIAVVPHFFHITFILNAGAAFGILENQRLLFILIAVFILSGVGYFYRKIPLSDRLFRFGLGLMAGGAVGNLIDRIATGYVIDFFDFRIWPIFNIADIAIVCGVIMMIYTIIFLKKKVQCGCSAFNPVTGLHR